jgi:tetraacyldisaccharide 4'-kinase
VKKVFELPLSLGYGVGISLWRWLYDTGVFSRNPSPVTTIGIGNITTGGSGKTPLVIALADSYRKKGRTVGVLSRGYGGTPASDPFLFRGCDDMDPGLVGDEPALMGLKLPECLFGISADRYRGARSLADSGADLVILDDAFQSLELLQDRQLVFFPEEWFQNTEMPRKGFPALVPYGVLRDYPETLIDADAILYNVYDGTPEAVEASGSEKRERIRNVLSRIDPRFGSKPLLGQFIRFSGIVDRAFRPAETVEAIRSRNVVLVSGIGRPERFHALVAQLGIDPIDRLILPDHVRYGEDVTAAIRRWLSQVKSKGVSADVVLTTEKDMVKWRRVNWDETDLRAVSIRSEPIEPDRWVSLLDKERARGG